MLIVGGGPAGSAAAIRLAKAGRPITVIERSAGPTDKVCGDFLSAEAIETLHGLGLDLAALSPAPIRRLRLVYAQAVAETKLPFPAFGLSRRVMDEALLGLAAASGAVIERGHAVRSIRADRGRLLVRTEGVDDREAGTVFLATGKHDLRDLPRPGRAAGSVGMKMYLRLSAAQDAALGDAIELILFPGGYAGLQRVDGGRVVLCLTIVRDRLKEAGTHWSAVLRRLQAHSPHLAARLADAVPLLERPLAIAGTPYGFLYRPAPDAPTGLFRLGDQACVIPSLTGDGVSIALHSGCLAADTWLARGNDAGAYHQRLRRDLLWQMRLASALQTACVRPWVQAPLVALCRGWTALPRVAARWTRLSGGRQPDKGVNGWRPRVATAPAAPVQ